MKAIKKLMLKYGSSLAALAVLRLAGGGTISQKSLKV